MLTMPPTRPMFFVHFAGQPLLAARATLMKKCVGVFFAKARTCPCSFRRRRRLPLQDRRDGRVVQVVQVAAVTQAEAHAQDNLQAREGRDGCAVAAGSRRPRPPHQPTGPQR